MPICAPLHCQHLLSLACVPGQLCFHTCSGDKLCLLPGVHGVSGRADRDKRQGAFPDSLWDLVQPWTHDDISANSVLGTGTPRGVDVESWPYCCCRCCLLTGCPLLVPSPIARTWHSFCFSFYVPSTLSQRRSGESFPKRIVFPLSRSGKEKHLWIVQIV